MNCPSCDGSGELESVDGSEGKVCPECQGSGEVDRHDGDGDPDGEAKYERDECSMLEE